MSICLSLHIELSARLSFVTMEPFLTTRSQEWSAKLPEKLPLWIDRGNGFFLSFDEHEKPPLKYLSHLGNPQGVIVDRCQCTNTGQFVAVKIMKTYSRKTTIEKLNKEVKILRLIDHYHSIRAIGSYTHEDSLGILTVPVADCDLHEYLFEDTGPTRKLLNKYGPRPIFLPRLMGCLAYGLKYIHEQKNQPSSDHPSDHSTEEHKIRHRDIKPSNILLHERRVLFADFGLSKVYTDTQTGTSGSSPKTQMVRSDLVL